MTKPMTARQATDKHECKECSDGGYCGYDCVLSSTCSVLCPGCKEIVYFSGDLDKQATAQFCCPYCGMQQYSKTLNGCIQRQKEWEREYAKIEL